MTTSNASNAYFDESDDEGFTGLGPARPRDSGGAGQGARAGPGAARPASAADDPLRASAPPARGVPPAGRRRLGVRRTLEP